MLFRMFAPRSLKRARRLTHPVSLLTRITAVLRKVKPAEHDDLVLGANAGA